jgi:hypothetical protein
VFFFFWYGLSEFNSLVVKVAGYLILCYYFWDEEDNEWEFEGVKGDKG